jgi:hypothetical protein
VLTAGRRLRAGGRRRNSATLVAIIIKHSHKSAGKGLQNSATAVCAVGMQWMLSGQLPAVTQPRCFHSSLYPGSR